jgi:zinc/manganese transport system permease protein
MNNLEWIELFSLPFMQRAVLGGVLLGTLGGILGSFVVLRQLSMYGNALGHASFLAVVIGAFLQLPSILSLTLFLVIFGLGVLYLIDTTNLGSDTILAIIVAGSVALGMIGFSFLEGYRGNLSSILFGDILAISKFDIIFLVLLLVITIVCLVLTLPEQILITFSPDLAQLKGIPVQIYRYSFIVLLSLTLALSIRAVGILLVNAFLIIPAATARMICDQFVPFLGLAAAIGGLSGIIGMVISGIWDLPSGPSIVLVQLMVFLAGVGWNQSSH